MVSVVGGFVQQTCERNVHSYYEKPNVHCPNGVTNNYRGVVSGVRGGRAMTQQYHRRGSSTSGGFRHQRSYDEHGYDSASNPGPPNFKGRNRFGPPKPRPPAGPVRRQQHARGRRGSSGKAAGFVPGSGNDRRLIPFTTCSRFEGDIPVIALDAARFLTPPSESSSSMSSPSGVLPADNPTAPLQQLASHSPPYTSSSASSTSAPSQCPTTRRCASGGSCCNDYSCFHCYQIKKGLLRERNNPLGRCSDFVRYKSSSGKRLPDFTDFTDSSAPRSQAAQQKETPAQPDEGNAPRNRFQVLCFKQVHRLHTVMSKVVPIHGKGRCPTLHIQLHRLIRSVRDKLQELGIPAKDIRLNGGAASYIFKMDDVFAYNDIDLVFAVDLKTQTELLKIREAVCRALLDFVEDEQLRSIMTPRVVGRAYLAKLAKIFKINDRWSLITLSNMNGRDVELKFVHSMKRQFEFSVDSFQVYLDSLIDFYDAPNQWRRDEGAVSHEADAFCCGSSDGDTRNSCSNANEHGPTHFSVQPVSSHTPPSSPRYHYPDPTAEVEEEKAYRSPAAATENSELPTSSTRVLNAVLAESPPNAHESFVNVTTASSPSSLCYSLSSSSSSHHDQGHTSSSVAHPRPSYLHHEPVSSSHAYAHDSLSSSFSHSENAFSASPQHAPSTTDEEAPPPTLPSSSRTAAASDVEETQLHTQSGGLNSSSRGDLEDKRCPPETPCCSSTDQQRETASQCGEENKSDEIDVCTAAGAVASLSLSSAASTLESSVESEPPVSDPDTLTNSDPETMTSDCCEGELRKVNKSMPTPPTSRFCARHSSEALAVSCCTRRSEEMKQSEVQNSPRSDDTGSSFMSEDETEGKTCRHSEQADSDYNSTELISEPDSRSPEMSVSEEDDNFSSCSDPCAIESRASPVDRKLDATAAARTRELNNSLGRDLVLGADACHSFLNSQASSRTPFAASSAPLTQNFGSTVSEDDGACSDDEDADIQVKMNDDSVEDVAAAGDRSSADSVLTKHCYPTVVAESMFGDFAEAFKHLQQKVIATVRPEEIRGGGLLKYCHLLVRGYSMIEGRQNQARLERYMCSRFFIDFPNINEQRHKLESYLRTHFVAMKGLEGLRCRYSYLVTLHRVVSVGTVCLMGDERRQILDFIRTLGLNLCRAAERLVPTQCHSANSPPPITSLTCSTTSASVAGDFDISMPGFAPSFMMSPVSFPSASSSAMCSPSIESPPVHFSPAPYAPGAFMSPFPSPVPPPGVGPLPPSMLLNQATLSSNFCPTCYNQGVQPQVNADGTIVVCDATAHYAPPGYMMPFAPPPPHPAEQSSYSPFPTYGVASPEGYGPAPPPHMLPSPHPQSYCSGPMSLYQDPGVQQLQHDFPTFAEPERLSPVQNSCFHYTELDRPFNPYNSTLLPSPIITASSPSPTSTAAAVVLEAPCTLVAAPNDSSVTLALGPRSGGCVRSPTSNGDKKKSSPPPSCYANRLEKIEELPESEYEPQSSTSCT